MRYTNTCGNCKFWVGVAKDNTTRGTCHRYPPDQEGFPRLYPENWCGEHVPNAQAVKEFLKEIDPTFTSFS